MSEVASMAMTIVTTSNAARGFLSVKKSNKSTPTKYRYVKIKSLFALFLYFMLIMARFITSG